MPSSPILLIVRAGSSRHKAMDKVGVESDRGSVTRSSAGWNSSFRTNSTRSLRKTMLRLTEPRSDWGFVHGPAGMEQERNSLLKRRLSSGEMLPLRRNLYEPG